MIYWKKEYSVNLEEIDEQHKVLIKLINNLENIYENMDSYSNFDSLLMGTLNELKNYTILHFSTEEVLMRMFDYDDFEEHKAGHDKFVALVNKNIIKVGELLTRRAKSKNVDEKERIKEEVEVLIKGILEFLQNWLIKHIMKSDKEYVEFFNKIQSKAKSSGGWLSFLR